MFPGVVYLLIREENAYCFHRHSVAAGSRGSRAVHSLCRLDDLRDGTERLATLYVLN